MARTLTFTNYSLPLAHEMPLLLAQNLGSENLCRREGGKAEEMEGGRDLGDIYQVTKLLVHSSVK